MEWINKIIEFFNSIGEFFVLVWNDEDRWWLIGGLLFFFIGFILKVVIPLYQWSNSRDVSSSTPAPSSNNITLIPTDSGCDMATITIKGIYQMNGPKPFSRVLEVPQNKTGYYSQLMTNKSRQAEWIKANFPGANTAKGFSMTINIK